MFRYLALAWNPTRPAHGNLAISLARRIQSGPFVPAFETEGLRVYCADAGGASHAIALANQRGVIVGTLFRRTEDPDSELTRPVEQLNVDDADALCDRDGAPLFSGYWGRYVAFLRNATSGTRSVLKDPTGRLPCYQTTVGDVHLFFSCVDDCIQLGLRRFEIDWCYVATRVSRCVGDWDQSGLLGVREVIGGTRITFDGDEVKERMLWTPTAIADSTSIEDPSAAATALRNTVRVCTRSWARAHPNVLCRVSGGLDSTIVLSCLHEAPSTPRVSCITYFGNATGSDELRWATIAARHVGHEITTCECAVRVPLSEIQMMRPLVNVPPDYSWALMGGFERELAHRRGATAVVTGDGGDSVFGSTNMDFVCRDFLRRHGMRPRLLSFAVDVALLRNKTVWSVLREALRDPPDEIASEDFERLRQGRLLVRAEAFESAHASHKTHPWFTSPARDARSDILAMVMQPDLFYNPLQQQAEFEPEPVYPLCSQPLIEVSLRIPSYTHLDGGRSRGLARRAFRGDIPPQIAQRQWKDAAQNIDYQLMRSHGRAIREFLLEGMLMQEGLLDKTLVERSLSDQPGKQTAVMCEITDHLIVEAWLRTWGCAAKASAAA